LLDEKNYNCFSIKIIRSQKYTGALNIDELRNLNFARRVLNLVTLR
jgi:hypothetical protein